MEESTNIVELSQLIKTSIQLLEHPYVLKLLPKLEYRIDRLRSLSFKLGTLVSAISPDTIDIELITSLRNKIKMINDLINYKLKQENNKVPSITCKTSTTIPPVLVTNFSVKLPTDIMQVPQIKNIRPQADKAAQKWSISTRIIKPDGSYEDCVSMGAAAGRMQILCPELRGTDISTIQKKIGRCFKKPGEKDKMYQYHNYKFEPL